MKSSHKPPVKPEPPTSLRAIVNALPDDAQLPVRFIRALLLEVPPVEPHASATATLVRPGCYTADEVAELLNITRARVYEMRAKGELPFVRVGERSLRFPKSEIDAYAGST